MTRQDHTASLPFVQDAGPNAFPESGCRACQKHYRLAAVAEMFDLSEKTVRRMVTERRIKAKRIGGSIRIPHAEVVKMVEDY
ncbi:helix-turn-helix domain-containing protein [candidate division KSB1 bacterium]|nr:helix-turn-helix domain-containing protein [candidate division KSB1 bacterium]